MRTRDQRPAVFSRLALAAALALTLAVQPARAANWAADLAKDVTADLAADLAADQMLQLEVVINGAPTHMIGEFTLRNGALLARPEELADLGFRVGRNAPRTWDGQVVVSDLSGLSYSLDSATQTVRFSASADRLVPQRLGTGPPPATGPPLESGTGVTLNYDVSDTAAGGRNYVSGFADLRLFSPWGVASTGVLASAGDSPAGSGHSDAVRLDSTYVYSDFANQRRYRLGDFISGGLAWTRPVRLGGAQVSHDFTMRPDLVTFPLPLVEGSAAVPSTVDVMVNGSRVLSSQVAPGPFQVPQLPVLNGAGTVLVTVTDAVGRQVTTTLPFYASPSLLAPGLRTWSVEVGAVRRNWGLLSNDYGDAAGSASWRGGLSQRVTGEAHVEGTSGQVMVGAGLIAEAFRFGVFNISAAGSSGDGDQGASFSVGFHRQARAFSFGVSGVFASSDFRDLAAVNGDPVPVRQITANTGVSLGRFGWAGLAYAEIDRDRPKTDLVVTPPTSGLDGSTGPGRTTLGPSGFPFPTVQNARLLTASYSAQFHRVSLYASAFHDFADDGRAGRREGAVIGLTAPLGPRSSVMASGDTSSASHVQVRAQQSVTKIGDFGYQVLAASGGDDHAFAQGQYKSSWALLTAGVDHRDGEVTGRADVQGALSFLDGALFASNLISDSFAVVDTGAAGGVRVLYENRDAGRTNAAGRRLVPDLRSFDVNRISIDPADLPIDALVPSTAREVRPPDRSGVVVNFPVRIAQSALLVLQDEQGRPIPLGSIAKLKASGAASPVGYDGQAFVEDLAAQNQLDVELPDGGACLVQFPFTPVKGDIPKVGPLICRRIAP